VTAAVANLATTRACAAASHVQLQIAGEHMSILGTISTEKLDRVSGGFDLKAAHQAGRTQMETGRVPRPYGEKPALNGATQCLLQPAMNGPLGYAQGFARNAWQQLTAPSPKPAPQPQPHPQPQS
jgi:hypothetical protein